ncbi:uncharacterized protein LOC131384169 [Hylobates moloch]|uniref:uncharacterized protein LOC131384169 n=1 Tax=Hylobates moloch TaxID=81572 RepID=UPI0026758089|nr:uncharacterized protein LOC131384169 [Hylobates moloch]
MTSGPAIIRPWDLSNVAAGPAVTCGPWALLALPLQQHPPPHLAHPLRCHGVSRQRPEGAEWILLFRGDHPPERRPILMQARALRASSVTVSWTPACATPSPITCRLKAAPPLWSPALSMGRSSAILARAVAPLCAQIMNLTHPVFPGGSYPIETEDGLIDLKTEKLDMTCCEKSRCNQVATVWRGLWGQAVGQLLLSLDPFLWALL